MTIRPAPRWIGLLLAGTLAAHAGWQVLRPAARPVAAALPPAPPQALLRVASLGDDAALARLLMLSLQAWDEQAGAGMPLRALDYERVAGWLRVALLLDPRSQYPLAAATGVYGAVADPARLRVMLDLVEQSFAADPARRWPWMVQATLLARHRLQDLPRARRYARAVRTLAPLAPPWARELEMFVLQDMGELEAARAVGGALLQGGEVRDPAEMRFLQRRLEALERQR